MIKILKKNIVIIIISNFIVIRIILALFFFYLSERLFCGEKNEAKASQKTKLNESEFKGKPDRLEESS